MGSVRREISKRACLTDAVPAPQPQGMCDLVIDQLCSVDTEYAYRP